MNHPMANNCHNRFTVYANYQQRLQNTCTLNLLSHPLLSHLLNKKYKLIDNKITLSFGFTFDQIQINCLQLKN